MAGTPVRDRRAVSEATGVAILIGFTVVVTASVGVGVLFLEDDGSARTEANFSFEYLSGNSMLIVTHERGDEIPAGEVVLEGSPGTVTWAEVASTNESKPVGPGDLIQLSANSAWSEPVGQADSVAIYHDRGDGNRTLLDQWD